jgi:hypothetical protein
MATCEAAIAVGETASERHRSNLEERLKKIRGADFCFLLSYFHINRFKVLTV